MKKIPTTWLLFSALVILTVIWLLTPENALFKQASSWQQLTSPGELSAAHAWLEKDCSVCHSAFGGIRDADCIACHALDQRLLGWPENIFHADLGNCTGCHPEHLGRALPPTVMDHSRLALLILDRIKNTAPTSEEQDLLIGQISMWLQHQSSQEPSVQKAGVSAEERLLNCYACHAGSDIHAGLFGTDCVECHQTRAWTIPRYRHPLGRSTACMECHKAPKSHFRGHFKKMPGRVQDCYMCHQTPSWLDIGHPPWYRQWMKQLKEDKEDDLFDEAPETSPTQG